LSKLDQVRNSFDILYPAPLFQARPWKVTSSNPELPSQSSGLRENGADSITQQTSKRVSTLDLLEALPIRPELEMDTFLEDIDQLIRDTDGAFKAVRNALADAKAATKSWYDTTPTRALTPKEVDCPVIPLNTIQRSPTIPRGAARRPPRATITHRRPAISRPEKKGKKAIKKKQSSVLSNIPQSRFPSSDRTISKWNLSDVTTNVVDVFNVKNLGKRFRVVEVDEMLTPGRLQQIRQEALLECWGRNSSDSSRSNDTATSDTPTEPFHLEDLSSRLDAARLQRTPPPPTLTPQFIPSITRKSTTESINSNKLHNSMIIDDLEFPITPLTQEALTPAPLRPQVRSRKNLVAQLLPTVPEVSPFNCSPTQFPYRSPSSPEILSKPTPAFQVLNKPTPLPQNDNQNLNLASTLYTRLSPLFLQGPIRISNSLLEARQLEKSYYQLHTRWEEAEPLDWTAFQVAILGSSLPEEYEDDESHPDIMEWWEGFAIGSPGSLVRGGNENRLSGGSLASSGIFEGEERFEADIDDDAEELTEDHVLELRSSPVTSSIPSPPPRNPFRRRKPLPFDFNRHSGTAELDSTSTSIRSSAPSTPASLPPSPMFDLVAPSGTRKGEEQTEVRIPMGFNLGHDLGDFLEWEMRHVPAEGHVL
jgi:hypothetical protein